MLSCYCISHRLMQTYCGCVRHLKDTKTGSFTHPLICPVRPANLHNGAVQANHPRHALQEAVLLFNYGVLHLISQQPMERKHIRMIRKPLQGRLCTGGTTDGGNQMQYTFECVRLIQVYCPHALYNNEKVQNPFLHPQIKHFNAFNEKPCSLCKFKD